MERCLLALKLNPTDRARVKGERDKAFSSTLIPGIYSLPPGHIILGEARGHRFQRQKVKLDFSFSGIPEKSEFGYVLQDKRGNLSKAQRMLNLEERKSGLFISNGEVPYSFPEIIVRDSRVVMIILKDGGAEVRE